MDSPRRPSLGTGDRDQRSGLENRSERSMTRSEEELRVDKRDVDAACAQLRKWVETEPVTANEQLERDVAQVNREPSSKWSKAARSVSRPSKCRSARKRPWLTSRCREGAWQPRHRRRAAHRNDQRRCPQGTRRDRRRYRPGRLSVGARGRGVGIARSSRSPVASRAAP